MEGTSQISLLVKIPALFALVMLTTFLKMNSHETARSSHPAVRKVYGHEDNVDLPADVMAALSLAHGNYEKLSSPEDLFNDLQSADVVLIGEAHWDQRDMQTAFEMMRILAKRRKIALAVERFPLTLQPRLEALNQHDSEVRRVEEMRSILETEDYQAVWRKHPTTRAGGNDSFDSSNKYYPSTDEFEAMMIWAAQAGIPIVGLDLPLAEREAGLGEDIVYRNEIWKEQIVRFLEVNQSNDYLLVAIGGINHFSNAIDSVQDKFGHDQPGYRLLSIGQRDANYSARRSLRVEDLAVAYGISDLIVQNPQLAVVLQNDSCIFRNPPDYWIAVHSVDSWEE